MVFNDIVQHRRSVKQYDTGHAISDQTLAEIFERVRLSPSSFNLQHWHFIVVRGDDVQQRLRKCAMDQAQVEEASAAIVVVGRANAHERVEEIYAEAPAEVRERMVPMITGFYKDKPRLCRDEAIRSASLAAMTLMYAAYDRGYATGPMIGFDPDAVAREVGLSDHEIPVMLIVIGRQVGDMRPRSFRYPVDRFVTLNRLDGPGLDAG